MTRRHLAAACLLLQAGLISAAQAAAPASGLVTTAAALAQLPEARLPVAEVRSRVTALKQEPLRFAVPAALNLDQRNGSWDTASPGVARWRLRVTSEKASSLSLLLTQLTLPTGAELWFYDSAGRDVQGPFTRDSAGLHDGELLLPLVRGGSAVLEVTLPAEKTGELAFRIPRASHGYRDITEGDAKTGPAGSESGSCNIDVVCTEGNNWRDQIRSTVLLTIDGQSFCTGSLVNNTRQDDRPLVLTANHCNIRSTNIDRITAYFNVQSSSCGGNQSGRLDQNIAASTFLARDENSDFTLFTLANPPLAAFNAFYAGWDARIGVAPQSGVTLHHPAGDEKKIAVYSTPGVAAEDVAFRDERGNVLFTVDAWRITYSRGTTEQGSSGSGLWNQNKQLVGVLSGGEASCASQTSPDFYGRMDRGWQANSASSGQLKAHLDPINTGCLQLNSKNPGTASPIAACAPTGGGGGTPSENGSGSTSLTALLVLLMGVAARRRRSASA
ncbi:MAG: serine protease [Stagnimonas sp.]|nr:serine protease [Stagnimonas sp.]